MISRKARKISDRTNSENIPDEVLAHIISFVPVDTPTSLVCRRWESLAWQCQQQLSLTTSALYMLQARGKELRVRTLDLAVSPQFPCWAVPWKPLPFLDDLRIKSKSLHRRQQGNIAALFKPLFGTITKLVLPLQMAVHLPSLPQLTHLMLSCTISPAIFGPDTSPSPSAFQFIVSKFPQLQYISVAGPYADELCATVKGVDVFHLTQLQVVDVRILSIFSSMSFVACVACLCERLPHLRRVACQELTTEDRNDFLKLWPTLDERTRAVLLRSGREGTEFVESIIEEAPIEVLLALVGPSKRWYSACVALCFDEPDTMHFLVNYLLKHEELGDIDVVFQTLEKYLPLPGARSDIALELLHLLKKNPEFSSVTHTLLPLLLQLILNSTTATLTEDNSFATLQHLISFPELLAQVIERGLLPKRDKSSMNAILSDESGLNLICYVAANRLDHRCIPLLLKLGLSIGVQGEQGITPLKLACVRSCTTETLRIVRELLRAGASPWMYGSSDSTILHALVRSGLNRLVAPYCSKEAAHLLKDILHYSDAHGVNLTTTGEAGASPFQVVPPPWVRFHIETFGALLRKKVFDLDMAFRIIAAIHGFRSIDAQKTCVGVLALLGLVRANDSLPIPCYSSPITEQDIVDSKRRVEVHNLRFHWGQSDEEHSEYMGSTDDSDGLSFSDNEM